MMLNQDPDVWGVVPSIQKKLKRIQTKIYSLRRNHLPNDSNQFLLDVCSSLAAAAHDNLKLIKSKSILEKFYPLMYRQYDLINLNGLDYILRPEVTISTINDFFLAFQLVSIVSVPFCCTITRYIVMSGSHIY